MTRRSTHAAVYRRDDWTCRMPECLCPDGRAIDPQLRGTDDLWAPSIDHITELSLGGGDNARNMRAAHRECNAAHARAQAAGGQVPERAHLTTTIGQLFESWSAARP